MSDMVACVEAFSAALPEMQPLLPLHWEELGIYKDRMPLDPQWHEYARLEAGGALLTVTLRNRGELIGYFIGIITGGLHYGSTLTCKMDIAYVLPEHRGGGGRILFDAVKAELKRRGVKIWWVGSKDHHPIEGFYRSLGFTQQETYFSMWLSDDA